MSGSWSRRLLVFGGLLFVVEAASARPMTNAAISANRSAAFSANISGVRPVFNPFVNPLRNPFVRGALNHSGVFRNSPLHGLPVLPGINPFAIPPNGRPQLTFHAPAPPNLNGYPIVPNPFVGFNPLTGGLTTLGQTAYGNNVLAGSLGFNPYLSSLGTGPLLSGGLGFGGNPYLGGAPNLGEGYGGGYGGGGYGGGYGMWYPPFAASLDGYADLTRATGQYWKDIGKARQDRETANQMMIDTQRKMVEYRMWLDSIRDTAPKMRDREMATDLEMARKNPAPTTIWSAKPLNDLLKSIQAMGKKAIARVASPTLDPDVVKHINVTDGTTRSSAGMFKESGSVEWPESLKEPLFEKSKLRLARNLRLAVEALKGSEPIDPSLVKDIKADLKELTRTLNDNAEELTPAQYIEAKRFLNQLSDAIRALSDPNAKNYFNGKWAAKGKNVAELVTWMTGEGVIFAPAAPGDEAAYNALYVALRNFEAALRSQQELSSAPDGR
jgi:hypothetical protein